VRALLRAAGRSQPFDRERNYALVQLLLQAGLRASETVSLRRADLALYARSGQVRVRREGGKRGRTLPLNGTARRALRSYLASRREVKADEPVFLSRRKRALSVRKLQVLLRTLGQRARIARPVTPYTLRHTFALDFLDRNRGQLAELQALLGHESGETTAAYTRLAMKRPGPGLGRKRHHGRR
jgi:site-specific recombinase XerD